MKLYLVDIGFQGYDSYDGGVIAAKSEDEAMAIMLQHQDIWEKGCKEHSIKLIGTAVRGTKVGVIHLSFNAG